MSFQKWNSRTAYALTFLSLLAYVALSAQSSKPAAAQDQSNAAKTPAASSSAPAQKTFASAQQAADAFLEATKTFDTVALIAMLGPEGESLVSSEDPVRDKSIAADFYAKAQEKKSVVIDPKKPNRAILQVGNDDWPLPIP